MTTQPLDDNALRRILETTGFEYTDTIWWRKADPAQGEHLQVFVGCNDVFAWAYADVEEITSENVDAFVKTFSECEEKFGKYNAIHAGDLFVARQRGLRPQGAYLNLIGKGPNGEEWVALFLQAGPAREVGMGNPHALRPAQQEAVSITP